MNEDRLRALYAGAMARLPDADAAARVSLDAMVELLERRGSEQQRSETLRLILRDPRAREEFELLRAVSRAGAEPRARWHASWLWRAAAAMALIAGAGVIYALRQESPEPLRGGNGAIATIVPADGAELTAPPSFVWHPVPGAVDYRLEVVDSTGTVVFEEQVRDTLSTGPTGGVFVPGQRYLWSVTALTREARMLRSTSHSFRLRAP